ncbi:Coenzyme F420 hydrogenase/dehydrogenase, beta subunit C-terminal domain [Microbacterium esteraromaticum]|uniref:Coenzyme F420 hydrogenase/dehydrogenase, beta subunit C-terminal domain n=1 Tax=Microbacterium esteraromaticum TaxID=57043 RepID=UPI003D3511EF
MLSAWTGWATDAELRRRGSSGGVLSALVALLASEGEIVAGAAADTRDPRRSVSVTITTREQALASAGSRYAPCAPTERLSDSNVGALVGKPCEVMGIRSDSGNRDVAPLLLSFFCAGVPNQQATDQLVQTLGVPVGETVSDLWYRGRGWPGNFTVERPDGTELSMSYDESWGRHLGPTVQWRCRVCPDGVGESADVAVGDFWHSKADGSPDFDESEGRSVVLVRTRRGQELLARAVERGAIVVEPVNLQDVLAVQPYHFTRRKYMVGRILGNALAGARTPRMRGFRLIWLARKSPFRVWHEILGTRRRRRAWTKSIRGHNSSS